MKKTSIIIGAVILLVGGWLLSSTAGQQQQAYSDSTAHTQTVPSAKADKAPDFALRDYKGATVKLADFAGKPLVINAWATWCPFCRQELPDFATAQKEFGTNVVLIAIDRAESLEVAKGYTDKQGTTGTLVFLLDPSDSFYTSIGGFSMPETIFVDRNGTITEHKRGPMNLHDIRQKIEKLISLQP